MKPWCRDPEYIRELDELGQTHVACPSCPETLFKDLTDAELEELWNRMARVIEGGIDQPLRGEVATTMWEAAVEMDRRE